ncbi:conserved hypothetical protein [Leishmania major strain Friedlin]|uniref:Methylated-DNA--protein-cysteine methyltransferase n=1 Tax=Leishmania major TaxID=5664 RepID=Q4Q912_LEIMA|nr:conserved hypothetical protein [Leishmania major strain Friedlin]CAG9576505.1 6-O-methylguanine_DNA_methyltransferase_-_DNA_binding_domain_containing_protein_-_putative [Leishmania major strain Friedlin]CAJ05437.1 conserved hypothetical protein [Leishmania major strain Friedlin]|eukprot:XP_001684186.1 conserved hypothetical protein [Leishmania major strain Friedlin]
MTAQAKLARRASKAVAASKKASKEAPCLPKSTSASPGQRAQAASALLQSTDPVQVYLRTVPTPLGPFSLYVDADGAVRFCRWQGSAPGDAAALFTEAQEVCAIIQSRWYKSTPVTVAGVSADGASELPGERAVTLMRNYFNPSTAKTGRTEELERLLLQVPIIYPPTTAFMTQTWATLRHTVPSGKTISYKGLGVRVNKALNLPASAAVAPRAIGVAMGANPIPVIVPCHRVLSSTNSLCGYGLGLRFKVWLLRHEQADVAADKLRVGEEETAVSTAASRR